MQKFHRFKVEKLIRDKNVERMSQKGFQYQIHSLQGQAYIDRLKEKLVEEAKEVHEATTHKDLLEELADVLEVLYGLAKENHISLQQMEERRLEKIKTHGGFDQRIYCAYADVPAADHSEIERLRRVPHKYPEIEIEE